MAPAEVVGEGTWHPLLQISPAEGPTPSKAFEGYVGTGMPGWERPTRSCSLLGTEPSGRRLRLSKARLPVGTCCDRHASPSPQMESPVSTPAVLPLHLLVPVVNNDISSPCEQIMVRTRSVGVNTCDVALATEPECLGPCEPGTSVNLEGIVWQETEDGKWRPSALQHSCSKSCGDPFLPLSPCLGTSRALCCNLGGRDGGAVWEQLAGCAVEGMAGQNLRQPACCVSPSPRQWAKISSAISLPFCKI